MKQLRSDDTDVSMDHLCLKFNVEKSWFLPQFFVSTSYFVTFCFASSIANSIAVSFFFFKSFDNRSKKVSLSVG